VSRLAHYLLGITARRFKIEEQLASVIRRWVVIGLAILLLVAGIGFFGFAPGYVESSMNRIDGKPLPKVSESQRCDVISYSKGR